MQKCDDHVQKNEQEYWNHDMIFDTMMDEIIINLQDDSKSSSESSESSDSEDMSEMAPTQSKEPRKTWDKEQMIKAIKMVREKKMGTLKAAKFFKIPEQTDTRTTLQRLSLKTELSPEEAATTTLGRKTTLGTQLENVLVEYILTLESKFHGLTRTDLHRMAYMLAVRNNLQNPFGESGIAGKTWLRLFLKRHKDKLSIRRPTGTSFARVFGFNKENVDNFFQLLEEIYEKNNYSADRVYTVDEISLTVVQSKIPQVIGRRGKRQIASLTSAERGSMVTIVVCMNATGHFVPPFIIFPRKNMNLQLMRGCPPGAEGVAHPSGWIQMNIFTDWFKHFINHTHPTPDSRALLILDGHFSHTRNIDLEGKAQVACSLKHFSNWTDLKTFLRSTFGEKKHATHLLSDLQHS
ncbi:uncharacterized protein LOC123665882 [Melitaea cinxia]|uniref:uncharacterized protein LOC123665882 n=1 Tax=Melitaea cinxia TaxID=113334 RepID=UPI001E2714FF|nr:uncharacterized protein LOC123665882 [Melitaea cinxia]